MGKIFVTGHRGASFPKPEQHGVGYVTPKILTDWLEPRNKTKENQNSDSKKREI